jgi:hypothetical protein
VEAPKAVARQRIGAGPAELDLALSQTVRPDFVAQEM